jgi:hypothetical protein
MAYGRSQRLLPWVIWLAGSLFVLLCGYLVVDSSGPNLRTDGTIVSCRYEEGTISTTYVEVGETSVPVRTEIPGSWVAEIDSSVLGRVEAPVEDDKLLAGQRVYLDYHIGRLSGQASVVGLRLQSELPITKR